MLVFLAREYGRHVKQVAPICHVDARSGPYFVDDQCVTGILEGVAWTMGCLLGGRRPRTLTSVRAEDVVFWVKVAEWGGGVKVRVPCARVVFRDEKYADVQGHRFLVDTPDDEGYAEKCRMSFAWWVYKLFRIRGFFGDDDPLCCFAEGVEFKVLPGFLDCYLFCRAGHTWWIDTLPVTVAVLSGYTSKVLQRMGSEQRGVSDHRSGFVTRAVTQAILRAELYWGHDCYARKVIDAHIDL
eukprot:jgi/Botrbrau1/12699/Bobra.67_1s0063.1